MLDTFKARLKAKAKALGVNLSTKRMDAIADRLHKKHPELTEEADHDKEIDDFHELQPLDELAKTDDRVRDLETKVKKVPAAKKDPVDDDDDDDDPDDDKKKKTGKKKDDETPAWVKKLQADLEALKGDKTRTSMQTKLAEKLKGKVPEKFYAKRALPDSEEELEDFIAEVENDWNDLKQEEVNAGLGEGGKPPGGGGNDNTDVADKTVKSSVDKFFGKIKPAEKTK